MNYCLMEGGEASLRWYEYKRKIAAFIAVFHYMMSTDASQES